MPWRRERLPTPVLWPREFHGLYSLWGCKESHTTERLSHSRSMPLRLKYSIILRNCPNIFLFICLYIYISIYIDSYFTSSLKNWWKCRNNQVGTMKLLLRETSKMSISLIIDYRKKSKALWLQHFKEMKIYLQDPMWKTPYYLNYFSQ